MGGGYSRHHLFIYLFITYLLTLYLAQLFSYSHNKLRRCKRSQISKETECRLIELINDTAVHRLADSRASALCVIMRFPSSLTYSYRGSLEKLNLILKVGRTLKLLAISYDRVLITIVRRNAASTILKHFKHTEKLKSQNN